MSTPPKKKKSRKRLVKKRLFIFLAGLTLSLTLIISLFFIIHAVVTAPDWHPDTLTNQKQTSIVYDKDGNQIAALHASENRQMVKSSDIPELVKKTFVAVEDKRFYEHFGVDPIRVMGSLIADVKAQSLKEGASTITMQLARNAFIENPTAKSVTRKFQEVALALQLERQYTKDEILTFYLNRIFFGQSSFGIQAAAKTYFGKELKDLKPDEIALLAGLPQAPSGYDPFVRPEQAKNRRTIVLGVMKEAKLITPSEYEKYRETPFTHVENVKKNRAKLQTASAGTGPRYKHPYFVDYVIDQLINEYKLSDDQIFSGGLKIYTTVDPKIQEAAEKEFAKADNFPKSVDDIKVQGAMTVMDPFNGAIRALVGGRDYTTARGFNRAFQATRQPGSIIKPLVVYAPALEKGGFFPGTVLDDMPVKYPGAGGKTWAPVNYDTETAGWKGRITMRVAVENSINVYAVKLINQVGIDYAWKFAKDKLNLPLQNDDKVLSLALGTNHVSTIDMASAYSTFPNNGIYASPHAVTKVLNTEDKEIITTKITKTRAMKETTAFLMNDLLRSVVLYGTGTKAQFGNWAVAGKTGTTSLPESYGNRSGNPDAWFAGYTPLYTGVVWMGYDSDDDKNHYLRKVYGGGYPAQIWKNVMTVAHQGQSVQTEFKQPPGIISGTFDAKSGLLPSSLTPDKFIRTEIAAQGDFPTRTSDIWVSKDIDADHPTYLAGEGTLNRVSKVFLNIYDRDPSIPWPSDEAPYRIPSETFKYQDATTPSSAPPTGNPTLPAPGLGAAIYDAVKGTVTLPVNYPSGSEGLTLIISTKYPGKGSVQTSPAQSDNLGLAVVTLKTNGKAPVPGEYAFWVAFKDAEGKVGPSSTTTKLTIANSDLY